MGDQHEGREVKEERFTKAGSVLRSEVKNRAHLGQPSQQRGRGSRCLISPHAGAVPGDQGGGSPNRAQNSGVVRDWEGQRKKGSSPKELRQDTTPQPLTPSLCPLRDDQRRPKHTRGRRVTGTSWFHLTGHLMAGRRASGQRAGCDTLIPTLNPSPGVPISSSLSPLGLCQWPEPLKPPLDIGIGSEVIATTFILEPPQLRKDSELLGRSQNSGTPDSPQSPHPGT